MHMRISGIEIKGRDISNLELTIDSFSKGFERGKTWPAEWNHLPGGPFVMKCGRHEEDGLKPEWLKCTCQHSQSQWDAWMKGFRTGVRMNPNLKPGHRALT